MNNLTISILFILFALIVSICVVYAGGDEPEADLLLGGVEPPIEPPVEIITILDIEYTPQKYETLKTNLEVRLKKMNIEVIVDEKITYPYALDINTEVPQIFAVWNYEASQGRLFTMQDNLILMK